MSVVVRDEQVSGESPRASAAAAVRGSAARVRGGARPGSGLLRWSLRAVDAVALGISWVITTLVVPPASSSLAVQLAVGLVPFVLAGCWLIAKQRLYLARVATMRTVEQAGLARVSVLLMVGVLAIEGMLGVSILPGRILVLGGLSFLCLSIGRTSYRGWLTAARKGGRFMRPVLIVGMDDQTAKVCEVIADHPELGFEAVGLIGAPDEAERAGLGDLWRGDLDRLSAAVADESVTGAIVSSTSLAPAALNEVTRVLFEHRCHVHLSTGITGIDQRRIRPMHLAYEPLLYLEALELTRGQLLAKRVLDVALSGFVAVLVAPLVAVSALAIKLEDRGPTVFFRQRRVGRDGELFTIVKLRTMTVGAEEHLDELLPYNERNGPLFKMDQDPRVTRVGRVLRRLSIDELPQLWNVLRGDMSLVGPRPALPSEARCFGERLQTRTQVLPGVTGLWQVEARTSASMYTYERLDLFYVENWSVGLDIMVIIATIEEELVKLVHGLLPRQRASASHPSVVALRDVGEGRVPELG
jgi:exopolysaccharide biosynthesis polyprenyl glycosylphosphotransferase